MQSFVLRLFKSGFSNNFFLVFSATVLEKKGVFGGVATLTTAPATLVKTEPYSGKKENIF